MVGCILLEEADAKKNLGIHLDKGLAWKDQIYSVCASVNSGMFALSATDTFNCKSQLPSIPSKKNKILIKTTISFQTIIVWSYLRDTLRFLVSTCVFYVPTHYCCNIIQHILSVFLRSVSKKKLLIVSTTFC